MNVDDLCGFITTAETGAVGVAADLLGISQPTLSRRIQRVERAVGASLFDRAGHRVVLNSRGVGFLPHARKALAELSRGAAEVARLMEPDWGTVRLDFMHSLGTWMVPDLLRTYRARYPHVEFQLHQGAAQELVDRVLAGEADLALVGPRPLDSTPHSLCWALLERQRLGIAVPADHWAGNADTVTMAQFDGEPFIGMLPGYGTRMLLDDLAAAAGVTPRFVFESMELTTVAGLVQAGLGSALLPLEDPCLQARTATPLDPPTHRELGLVWRPGDDAPAVAQFRDFVCQAEGRPAARPGASGG